VKSIFDVITVDGETKAPEPMPTLLTQLGCGYHEFKVDADGAYRCQNAGCTTVVRQGQILHPVLKAWMDGNHG